MASTIIIYIVAPNCIFVDAIEFNLIEQKLPSKDREKFEQTGFPKIKLEDGFWYNYLPITINDKSYKLIAAKRPVMEKVKS